MQARAYRTGTVPVQGGESLGLRLDACEVRLCPPCVRVCACVSRLPRACVLSEVEISWLPPVSFYR